MQEGGSKWLTARGTGVDKEDPLVAFPNPDLPLNWFRGRSSKQNSKPQKPATCSLTADNIVLLTSSRKTHSTLKRQVSDIPPIDQRLNGRTPKHPLMEENLLIVCDSSQRSAHIVRVVFIEGIEITDDNGVPSRSKSRHVPCGFN